MKFCKYILLVIALVMVSPMAWAGWQKPACASGDGALKKKSNSYQWRCRKKTGTHYVYRKKGTTSSRGQCLSVGGLGYHWAKRDNKWKCCGTSPVGETCASFTSNAGKCPSGYSKRNTSNGDRVCRKSVNDYQYNNPIFVNP